MSEQLKPCPFCGVIPETPKDWDDGVLWCNNEDCPIKPEVQDLNATKQSAIAAWNTRKPDAALVAALKACRARLRCTNDVLGEVSPESLLYTTKALNHEAEEKAVAALRDAGEPL